MQITIRPFRGDDTDYEALAMLRGIIWPEYRSTVAEYRRWDEKREARLAFRRFVAEADGQPVAMAYYEHVPWMYHPQKFYGSVFVHPEYRGRGIASLLYTTRKELTRRLGMRGIVAGGALPGYQHHAGRLSVEAYIAAVCAGELFDPTLSVQLKNGFAVRDVLRGYVDGGALVGNDATMLVWEAD